jgi:hypothetical protein
MEELVQSADGIFEYVEEPRPDDESCKATVVAPEKVQSLWEIRFRRAFRITGDYHDAQGQRILNC